MKVLFFITSSMERPSPSWHLMKTLLEATLNAGFSIHAIQRHYNNSSNAPFPEPILSNERFTYSEVPGKSTKRGNFVLRYLNGINYAIRARKQFRKHNDFDLVFVQSAPTSLYYILTAKHFAKNRPVIYNSQDMFPGSAVANGSMPRKWMQKIFYRLQKIAYQKADIITAISEDMKTKLMEQGVPENKIRVIVNWYDENAVHEVLWEENRFVREYNLSKDKFYVQYAGTMGTNFNPDIVLDVAERLKDYREIEFQMIGKGVRKVYFERAATERSLSNIVFYPLQPQDMVSDVYSACSVCLIPLKEGVIGNSVPSKAGLLMACGRVIINSVDESSDYGRMFERERIGFSAGVRDRETIVKRILLLCKNPAIRMEYEYRAKMFGIREYSSSINTKKYTDLFEEMIQL